MQNAAKSIMHKKAHLQVLRGHHCYAGKKENVRNNCANSHALREGSGIQPRGSMKSKNKFSGKVYACLGATCLMVSTTLRQANMAGNGKSAVNGWISYSNI